MKIKAIVTGSTGMVGEGVLHECLKHPDVEQVLALNRRPCGVKHPKLKEIIVKDFFDLSSVEDKLKEYNACYFCLGISSVGISAEEYYKTTYTLTINFAQTLVKLNPDMVFCYVSGSGTDSTEKGKLRWARVKGKTENDLIKLPFKDAYMFHPALLKAAKGSKNTPKLYIFIMWLYPVLRFLFPGSASTLRELGLAMINITKKGYDTKIVEVRDIVKLARE